ncbi:MAG TPA: hemolysin family protein [Holophaga sp.]|nr:hemolysin family protein [Holophaga sp.]
MADPDLNSWTLTHPWLILAGIGVLAYRALMASLLEAFHTLPSIQRRRMLEEDSIQNPLLAKLLERPHAMGLGLTLFNQALLVILLGLMWPILGSLVARVPGGAWGVVLLTLGYVWLMDLAIPTFITAGSPARWILWLFPFYAPAHRLIAPLIAPLARHIKRQLEAVEKARDAEEEPVSEDAVTALLEEGEAEGILEEDDRELIRNVVGFGDTVVREVMTPRTQIQGISIDAGAEEMWAAFRESRHSRLPVFEATIDTIKGVLLLKDLMQHDPDEALNVRALMKSTLFVPESKHVMDLLRQLQRARTQMAVVVDEFGSVSGVVSMEDLLEEIFGEIREEHEDHPEIQALEDGSLLVSGHVHIEDLEARLGLSWERSGFDTVAGLVMARLGHVPQIHEALEAEGTRFVVTQMEGPRILQVRVKPLG